MPQEWRRLPRESVEIQKRRGSCTNAWRSLMYMRLEEEKESGKDDEESDKKEENREKVRQEKKTLMRS